ncbi:MAG: hypothetical protein JW751_16265 [Polyangiaceae bacterium]|nr:hypothetical protein [Polyangiaceae bacterium]
MVVRRSYFPVLIVVATACAGLSRDELLAGKTCTPSGECVQGYTCVEGICERADGSEGVSPHPGGAGGNNGDGGDGPSVDGSEAGDTATGSATQTGGAPGCTSATIDPCSTIPRFQGAQTLDGDDSDVCALPTFAIDFFDANDAVLEHGTTVPESERPESASVRVGWSPAGLHLFITVSDPLREPARLVSSVWEGDGVEVLFTSSGSKLDGDPATDRAFHAIFAGAPSLAGRVTTRNGVSSISTLNATWYETSVRPDGYVVETLLPWTDVTPSSGANIAFDFALNSADGQPLGGVGRDAEALLRLAPVSTTSPCLEDPKPWCDTRTWCTPTLE